MKRKIAVLIGTRPEAIKMAPIIAALRRDSSLQPTVISSGQHRQMIDQVIQLFGIQIDMELSAMEPNQTLAGLTSRTIERVDRALSELAPDFLLVQGDTTTVLCGALASFYRRIPIGHVEAGLRTGDVNSPFPEEANRRLTTPLATLHFAPTETARLALLREHVPESSITVSGNTVVDALLMELKRQQDPLVEASLFSEFDVLLGSDWRKRALILTTGHRRENFGEGFEQICLALSELARLRPDSLIVFPVHLNPNVANVVRAKLGDHPNIRLLAPQPYAEFVALAKCSKLILTDSGGVQEEAPTLGAPVLVMRETTERPEGLATGGVKLVGARADRIVAEALYALDNAAEPPPIDSRVNPYGDGLASGRIIERIRRYFES